MKWNFMMIQSIIQLTFVLWCGVVTSAQDNEPLRKNTNTIVCPGPTAAVDFINASNPALLSEMTLFESETSGEYHCFPVKGLILVMICFAVVIVVAATVYRWLMSQLYNSTKQGLSSPLICSEAPINDGADYKSSFFLVHHQSIVSQLYWSIIQGLSSPFMFRDADLEGLSSPLICSEASRNLGADYKGFWRPSKRVEISGFEKEERVSWIIEPDSSSGSANHKPFESSFVPVHHQSIVSLFQATFNRVRLNWSIIQGLSSPFMFLNADLEGLSSPLICSEASRNLGADNKMNTHHTKKNRKFAIIKFIPVVFFLWYTMTTNRQGNDTFRKEILMKNGTSIFGSRPIWDVGIMNSTETAQLSQMTLVKLKTQPNVRHHIFVKATRTNTNSCITVFWAGTSPPRRELKKDSESILDLIIGRVTVFKEDTPFFCVVEGADIQSPTDSLSIKPEYKSVCASYEDELPKIHGDLSRDTKVDVIHVDFEDSSSGTARSGASKNVGGDLTDSSFGTVHSVASTTVESNLTTNIRYTNMKQNFAWTMLIPLVVLLGQVFTNAQNNDLLGKVCHELLTKNVEWVALAGAMNLSRGYRDNDDLSRAEKILSILNHREDFSRKNLAHSLEEIQQLELVRPVTTGLSRSLSYPAAAEEGDYIPMSIPMKCRSKVASICPVVGKKIITVKRNVILTADIVLNISSACLAKDTEITLKNDDQNVAFRSSTLLNLRRVKATSPIVEFSPDDLNFSKPAILTTRFEKTVSDSELFILDGSYKWNCQRTVKEVSTNFTKTKNPQGAVSPKINSFYLHSQILSWHGKLTRLLNYFDRSFTVRADTFNRRLPSKGTVYISCEFVNEKKEEIIKQLKVHFEPCYVGGKEGMLTRVHTVCCPKTCIDFAVVERTPFSFKVNKSELDSVGFVVEFFMGISIKSPASRIRKIREVNRNAENKFLWRLNVLQMEEEINVEEACVVHHTTKLTNGEITQMSEMIGEAWDSLAALVNIPYSQREEIRVNYAKYPSSFFKAKPIFTHINHSKYFNRYILKKIFKELGRNDLENEMLPVKNENGIDEAETPPLQRKISVHKNTENIQSRHTRLSSREMYRLSRHIGAEWDIFAGLMGIPRAERNDIRDNFLYNNNCSRAEKILSMLNRREDFSREILAHCLEEIQQSDLVRPVIAGEWRSLSYPPVAGEEDCIPMSTPMERRSEIQSTTQEPPPEVRNRTTKLTKGEIIRMSDIVGVDCDSLAGLMDVPYRKREQIRDNYKYSSSVLKAMQVFTYFNDSKYFDRCNLKRCFKELGRHDLENEMLPVKNENGTGEAETSPLQSEISVHKKTENIQLRYIPLSPREMYRLSRCICDKWDILAGLMNIPRANRNNIRHDNRYINNRSRAEKILSIINHRKDFSRTKLADCLEEMQQLDLIRPVTTGEWRSLPCPAIVGQEECIPMMTLMERRSKISSKCACLGKNIITVDGGLIQSGDIVLNISPGCLANDAEITLKRDEQNFTFKSLPSLGIFKATPPVMEFLANVLKFIKPAIITIGFEKNVSDSEQFILYGSCGSDYQNTVWKLMTNSKEGEKAQGYSHFNSSFTCCSYAFYRRLLSMGTIDISVVLLSEFVNEKKEEKIKQLTDNVEASYVRGGKGTLKCVRTGRRLICLDFSVVESTPFSVGFVVDHFKRITKRNPASGKVKIRKVNRNTESEYMRKLNVLGMEEQINVGEAFVQSTAPDPLPEVVYRTTKLTKGEITRMSDMVGLHWDSLSGLMDIPHSEREEIRVNYAKYPSFSSKAKQIFTHFNGSKGFDRRILQKYFKELGRHDLKDEMLPVENENGANEEKTQPSQSEISVHRNAGNIQLRYTRLSSREMYRLSRHIDVEWDTLAGLTDIPRADRNDIRDNILYNNNCSRAEKILSIFNHREDFSRENLAYCLKEINQLELIRPVTTGEWRSCMMLTTEQQLSFKLAGWYF